MKVGDTVTRKWKPQYGEGIILHILGDEKVIVKWYGARLRPLVLVDNIKYLKAIGK